MIRLQLEVSGSSRRLFERVEREAPRTFRAAHGAAATRAQNRLRKVMRIAGGEYGVPSFAPLSEMSKLLRPNREPGGALAEKSNIQKFRMGQGQVIGWVDRLASWADCYQGAKRYPFTRDQKAKFHRWNRQLDGFRIPSYYDRPARAVIDPFADHLATWFPQEVVAKFNKKVARTLAKGREVR